MVGHRKRVERPYPREPVTQLRERRHVAGEADPDGADDPLFKMSQMCLALAILDWVVLMAVGLAPAVYRGSGGHR